MAPERTIKIRYTGVGAKRVDLPVPYISHTNREGHVTCNPVGEFPYKDGIKLLEISGPDGPFQREEEDGKQ